MSDGTDRVAELELELLRERIAHQTGVPPSMVAGYDEQLIGAAADAATTWRDEWQATQQPPRPLTAAVSAAIVTAGGPDSFIRGPQQIYSRDQLRNLPAAQVLARWKRGELAYLGASAPTRHGRTPMDRSR